MLHSKNCGSTKFWITHLCFHKMCGKLFENFVDPQSWKPKNCGSTKFHIKILWIHKNAKDWEITALMHLDWKKRPRGSPRIFFWGVQDLALYFFLMSLGLISRNLLGYKRTHRCYDFHFFRHKKKYWPKKQFLFLNRLRSQTCFNRTGIDQ